MTWTLIDGGTGQELLRRTEHDPTPLWSTQVMLDEPRLVVDVHRSFVEAGAEVITANAYSATPCRLEPFGLADRAPELQRLAVELADEARAGRPDVRVAGCLSPYRWTYRPELAPSFDELVPHYRRLADWQDAGVDVFLCETMGSVREARAASIAASGRGVPVWTSFTVDDAPTGQQPPVPRLRDGTALAVAVDALPDDVDVVLVNCSTPEAITAAVDVLARSGRPFGAYANGFANHPGGFGVGATADQLGERTDLDATRYADFAEAWIAAGATVVGGCCHVGPSHIAELARRRIS